jgi:hypothetical protein
MHCQVLLPVVALLAGLPDGIFNYQKYQFWYIFEGLIVKNLGIVNHHFIYISCTFSMFSSDLVCFEVFGVLYRVLVCCTNKNLATLFACSANLALWPTTYI